ncbi:LINE-1 retrotransposable element ORF2 protein [Carassius carassius]|uniref:LINE-1 retrotransposable element ORF2 protein n=1 Tax=Carassius carassius TaxID=217509 RepID=UPI0028697672|nr:LINE-1 retrotransposable element ORF2 protein [Carassius carassius]
MIELPQEMVQRGRPSSESSIEVLHTPNTSSQNLLNFLNHLHQTERFEDIKSTLITVLSEPVSRKEILNAILSLPQSESLTADGLTVHFYKCYACKIIDLLHAFFNQIFDLKPIKQTSLNQGKTDHTYCYDIQYSFSPITIINVDYKILALILAERLKSVIEHILNPGQSKPHISILDDISDRIPVIISLKLDPGALKWPYLFNSLKSVNLPDRFRSVLKLFLIADHRSQGLRVGCPLTPLLVSICLLPLINAVNCQNMFLGSKVQEETIKSAIDEDRALIFLSNSNEALDSFEKMLRDFIETSGFAIHERCSNVFIAGSSGFSLG